MPPSWIPAERGSRYQLRWLVNDLPLVRNAAVTLMETANWLPNHSHRWWELHYIHRGNFQIEVPASGANLIARGGSFILTRPGIVHRARDGIMSPFQLAWVQLDLAVEYCMDFTASELSRIRAVLTTRAETEWTAPPETEELFRELRELVVRGNKGLTRAAIRLAVARLILLAAAPAGERRAPAALGSALAALESDLTRPCTVAVAARRAGISPARLHALCARHLGTTPAAWQLSRRLDAARKLLAAGESVQAVTRSLCFSSPRYFAFAFRREIGVPPSLYAEVSAEARSSATLRW